MVRVLGFIILFCILIEAEEIPPEETLLYQNCISCHVQQQIPSELIYRRYLQQYGTRQDMLKAIIVYLKKPQMDHSIMPQQFFMRFPPKVPTDLNDTELTISVEAYLQFYDIGKRLVLPDRQVNNPVTV